MHAPVNQNVCLKRVTQPLPLLPSFLPAAVILSYFGYSHESWLLLQFLSKKTNHYYLAHRDVLLSFLIVYKPPTPQNCLALMPATTNSFSWPPEDVFRRLPRDIEMKSLILYGNRFVYGLEIHLGSKEGSFYSPLFGRREKGRRVEI